MIRLFGYFVSRIFFFLGLIEASVVFGAVYLAIHLRFAPSSSADLFGRGSVFGAALLFTLVISSSMISMGLYQRGVQERAAGFVVRLTMGFMLGSAVISLFFYMFPGLFLGRGILGLSLLLAFLGILLARALFVRFAAIESRKRRVLVVGTGVNAHRIQELENHGHGIGFSIVGYIPVDRGNTLIDEYKHIKTDKTLLDIAIEKEVDEIVVAPDDRRRRLPVHEILDCKMSGFEVLDLITFFEKESARISIDLLHPSWIFFSDGFRRGVTGLYGKRALDVVVSILLLVATWPLMLLIAVTSFLGSLGRDPVLYHQVRVGQNGKLFRLHKFRSMRVDAEADGIAQWAQEHDDRVTRLGSLLRKTRLDELPQIFNVLKGDMSLVGPRPERPEFVERLSCEIPFYAERHRVKPGVTGWAQLLYPYASTDEDTKQKLEYDLYYVKNAGIVLDLIILLQTVEVVLLGKGAR